MTTPRKSRPQPDQSAILWTAEEVAAALYTFETVIERERERGLLRGVKVGGGPWRYRPADVRAYVDGLVGGAASVRVLPEMPRPRKHEKAG